MKPRFTVPRYIIANPYIHRDHFLPQMKHKIYHVNNHNLCLPQLPQSLRNMGVSLYSKIPIYRGVWGKENIRGKLGFAVNRGFACLQYAN